MKLLATTALSLAFHALLVGIFWVLQVPPKGLRQPLEVVYHSKTDSDKPEQKFIKNLEVPNSLKFEDPAKTEFASERRNRVLLETRAQKVGITKNRSALPKFLNDFQDQPRKKWLAAKSDEGFQTFNPRQELQDFTSGESTVSIKLPDQVAVGSFTALNTDRHLYYSFYSRLEDMIYLRWSNLIQQALQGYSKDFKKKKLLGRSLRTDVLVFLKPNGEFYKAQIQSASGLEKIDFSPALAFQDARIFPNPPVEMVRSDGYIHVSYSFIVDFGQVQ